MILLCAVGVLGMGAATGSATTFVSHDLTLSFDSEPYLGEFDSVHTGYRCRPDGKVDFTGAGQTQRADQAFVRDGTIKREGSYSAHIFLHSGDFAPSSCDKESVSAIKGLPDGEGTEGWYGWSWRFPTNWAGTDSWGTLFEIMTSDHTRWPSYGQMTFDAAIPGRLRMQLKTGHIPSPGASAFNPTPPNGYRATVTLLGPSPEAPRPFTLGIWHDFYMHIAWRSRSNGILTIWHRPEGGSWEKLYDNTGSRDALIEAPPHPTMMYNDAYGAPGDDGQSGLVLVAGFYRAAQSIVNDYWFDGFRRRQSEAAILGGFSGSSTSVPAADPTSSAPAPAADPVSTSSASGGGGGTGLSGSYYKSIDLTGTALTRTDPTVNFNWGFGEPASGVGPDNFSVRWAGRVRPRYSQTYRFYTLSDDGVRLWVNGQLLINNWTDHPVTENSGTITLTAGQQYDIKLEYYDHTRDAIAKLLWSSPSQTKEPIPQSQLEPGANTAAPAVEQAPTSSAPAPAADPVSTSSASGGGGGTGLSGSYYKSIDLTGTALTRTDPTVNFNWGFGEPASGVGPDNFSVRWAGRVRPRYSQTYRFYTLSDDGVRLWVNGQLLINNWTDHPVTENSGTITLTAGQQYDIKLEYYDHTRDAIAKLLWSSPSQTKEPIPQSQLEPGANTAAPAVEQAPTSSAPAPAADPVSTSSASGGGGGTGLSGSYYKSIDLTGTALTRTDPTVNFNWGFGEPASGVGPDNFSVRWAGRVRPRYSQTYRFYTLSDDGVRLWVNGQLLINNWTDHPVTENSGTITLTAGQQYDIKLEYYDHTRDAIAKLLWSSPSQTKEPIPQSQLFG